MSSVNKVIILGNLGQDPELKTTQGGQAVATISVATSETWVKDGKKEEKTEWHRCVAWGKLGENIAKYLKKGSKVYLEGKLQTRSWDDQQGQKRYTTEIIVRDCVFVSSKSDGGSQSQRNNPGPSDADMPQGGGFGDDSDVPF